MKSGTKAIQRMQKQINRRQHADRAIKHNKNYHHDGEKEKLGYNADDTNRMKSVQHKTRHQKKMELLQKNLNSQVAEQAAQPQANQKQHGLGAGHWLTTIGKVAQKQKTVRKSSPKNHVSPELGKIIQNGVRQNLKNSLKQRSKNNSFESLSSSGESSSSSSSSSSHRGGSSLKESLTSSDYSSTSREDEERDTIIGSEQSIASLICSTDDLHKSNRLKANSMGLGQARKINQTLTASGVSESLNPLDALLPDPNVSDRSRQRVKKSTLSKLQEDILAAIETLNYSLFVDLGGTTTTSLNFFRRVGRSKIYPIMSAAAKGSEEMVNLVLMNKNVDIQAKNENQVNSFWIACLYGHGVVMKRLGEAGIDIFCKNKESVNVLHVAVTKNYQQIVEMLLESGFPLDHETSAGMTAFQLAAYHGHLNIIELMIQYLKDCGDEVLKDKVLNKVNPKTNLSTLAYSILNQNKEISVKLIEFGAETYYGATDAQKDFSPIFMAVQKLNKDLLEIMCDHGASLTVKNSVGMTPLMFAAEQNYQQVVNYLSLRTRDLNEEDANSVTILVHMLFSGEIAMASRLIVRGANIDYVNRNGNTALHLCVENKLKEAVQFLLFKGANPHIMDLTGEDACDKAKRNGIARDIPEFNNCNITKKILPLLPDGRQAEIADIPQFRRQIDEQHKDSELSQNDREKIFGSFQGYKSGNASPNPLDKQGTSIFDAARRPSIVSPTLAVKRNRGSSFHVKHRQGSQRNIRPQKSTEQRVSILSGENTNTLQMPKPNEGSALNPSYRLRMLTGQPTEPSKSDQKQPEEPQYFDHDPYQTGRFQTLQEPETQGGGKVLRKIKEISQEQITQMREIANDLNIDFRHQLQQERDDRNKEFKKFKREQETSLKRIGENITKKAKFGVAEVPLNVDSNVGPVEYTKVGDQRLAAERSRQSIHSQSSHPRGQSMDVLNSAREKYAPTLEQIQERNEEQYKKIVTDLKQEMKNERKEMHKLILEQSKSLMENGLSSVYNLSARIRDYGKQREAASKSVAGHYYSNNEDQSSPSQRHGIKKSASVAHHPKSQSHRKKAPPREGFLAPIIIQNNLTNQRNVSQLVLSQNVLDDHPQIQSENVSVKPKEKLKKGSDDPFLAPRVKSHMAANTPHKLSGAGAKGDFMDLSQGSFDEDVTFAETLLQGIEVQVNETLQKMSKKQFEMQKKRAREYGREGRGTQLPLQQQLSHKPKKSLNADLLAEPSRHQTGTSQPIQTQMSVVQQKGLSMYAKPPLKNLRTVVGPAASNQILQELKTNRKKAQILDSASSNVKLLLRQRASPPAKIYKSQHQNKSGLSQQTTLQTARQASMSTIDHSKLPPPQKLQDLKLDMNAQQTFMNEHFVQAAPQQTQNSHSSSKLNSDYFRPGDNRYR